MGDRASAAMKIAFIVARVFNSLRCIFESATLCKPLVGQTIAVCGLPRCANH
jgi:hypothetical protein